MKINRNVVALGYTPGKDILLCCNQRGLDSLPEPFRIEKGPGWHEPDDSVSASFYVWLTTTTANLTALVLLGVIKPENCASISGANHEIPT